MGGINEIKVRANELTNLTVILWGCHTPNDILNYLHSTKFEIILENDYKKIVSNHYPRYTYYIMRNKNFELLKTIIKNEKDIVVLYFFPEKDVKNEDKILIKKINEIKDNTINHFPFIVFISNIPREEYLNYINENNINLDPLNILSYNDSKREFIFKILEDLENYYHERPNRFILSSLGLNLCVLGNPGKGKSSFINCVAEKKIALEGKIMDTTRNFTKYSISKKINNDQYGIINIYDCPGLNVTGDELNLIKKSIDEKFEIFKKNHDFIHGFLYFIYKDKTDRALDKGEKDVIIYIYNKLIQYNQNSIILFIINNHLDDENSPNSYKKRLFFELNRVPEIKGKFENENNIIYVNLKKNIIGIDKVFNRLYDYFNNHKVPIINRNDNETQIHFEERRKLLIKQSMFFKYIEKEEDIINREREACDAIINDCVNQTKQYGKKLHLEEIKELRQSMLVKLKKQLESSANIESQELKDTEIYDKTFFKKIIKKIPILGKWLEGNFMEEESPKVTREIGRQFIEMHINNMMLTSGIDFCSSAAQKYNNSVDLLEIISIQFSNNLPENIKEIENNKIEEKVEKKELKESITKYEIKEELTDSDFIIKFTTDFKEPIIKIDEVSLFSQEYLFRFGIRDPSLNNNNYTNIIHTKKIADINLDKVEPYKVDKNNVNEKCNVSIFYKLKIPNFKIY